MPGTVTYTSTVALTNVTLLYVLQLANKGWGKACDENGGLQKGLNVVYGEIVYKEITEAFES